jgi:DNA-binding MarR family transcriptional regulator
MRGYPSAMTSPTQPVLELTGTELGAWRGMLRVHAALVRELDAELDAAHELPLSSYDVLIYLQAAPDKRLRMAELADSVLLSRSGVTRLVDRLEREGLIVRDTCTSDGRGCFAVLTQEGEDMLARARPTHLEGVRERFLRHFTEDELTQLATFWERVKPGAADLTETD